MASITNIKSNKDGSQTVTYTPLAQLLPALDRLIANAQPIAHAPECRCAKCSAERLRQAWQ